MNREESGSSAGPPTPATPWRPPNRFGVSGRSASTAPLGRLERRPAPPLRPAGSFGHGGRENEPRRTKGLSNRSGFTRYVRASSSWSRHAPGG